MSLYINPQLGDGLTLQDPVVVWLAEFYKTSDTRDALGAYVDSFTADATVFMGSKQAAGHDEITALRKGMWQTVQARKHAVHQIYQFGRGTAEYMLTGTVSYTAHDGSASSKEWAAHAVFAVVDGVYRLKLYQVYLDTAPKA